MPEITGRLLADMHPNGTVRLVFIAHTGGGNEAPLTAKTLDAAEMDFVRMCGLTPERASALRTELDRNKVVAVETSIDAAVAAKFRYAKTVVGIPPGARRPLPRQFCAAGLVAWVRSESVVGAPDLLREVSDLVDLSEAEERRSQRAA